MTDGRNRYRIPAAQRSDAVRRAYIGDAVYAAQDAHGAVWLTVEDGRDATDEICLEVETIAALLEWLKAAERSAL